MRFADAHRLTIAWRFAVAFAKWVREQRHLAFLAAVEDECERQGIAPRMRAVDAAIRTPAFDDAFHAELEARVAAGNAPTDEVGIYDIACTALRGMGLDLTDVQFTVFWAGPDGNKEKGLGPNVLRLGGDDERCSMTPAATQRCVDAIAARAEAAKIGEGAGSGEELGEMHLDATQAEARDAA